MSNDRVYVIAEAGVNHNGDLALARALVEAAADAGADAVKFQTFDAKKLASSTAPKADYQRRTTDTQESQLAMLQKLELPLAWHEELRDLAHGRGVEFLSTAFDQDSLRFLVELGVPRLKVPSGELTNAPLLWQFARTGLPLILSTGMATLSEVEQALAVVAHALGGGGDEPRSADVVWRAWADPACRARLLGHVTLLHCTSQYPTPFGEANLRAMDTLGSAFGLGVGYSDHTEGNLISLAAVARGARLIEKHFTIDRSMPGPDHKASLEPQELKRLVAEIRAIEVALGSGAKAPQPSECGTREAARQQVVAARPVVAGAVIEREDLTTARCGWGLPPIELWSLIGTTASRGFAPGEPIER